jgi:hypothetical protein
METLAWLEQTDLSLWLRESDWGHPIVLCFHAVGMALVVGVSFVFCARVLGFSKAVPLAAFDTLFTIAWYGFAVNAASGVLLYIAAPRRLLLAPAFLIKLVFVILAGLSLWVLMQTLSDLPTREAAGHDRTVMPTAAKLAAIFPIVLWLSAIVAGRLIGYTIGPPPV